MQTLYVIITFIQVAYFLFKKRKIDLFTVSFFSSVIYFLPGLFGYVVYPGRIRVEIHYEVYIVFIMVQCAIWGATLFKDLYKNKKPNKDNLKSFVLIEAKYISFVLSVVCIIIMLYYLITLNTQLLQAKSYLMPLLGPLFILMRNSAMLSFLLAYLEKKYTIMVFSGVVLLFTFLIGFRSPIAITGIAIFILYFMDKGRSSFLLTHYKKVVLVSVFGYIMIMGKIFYGSFKSQGIAGAISRMFDKEYILIGFSSIESFGVQTILNEVMVRNFYTGVGHLEELYYQILVAPSLFKKDLISFNDLFQSSLFPQVEYGMAYNIWAEALSSGGYSFLILIIFLFVIGLMIFDKLFTINNILIKAVTSLCSVYWGFYIHRSSISIELTFQRHILYTLLFGLVISIILTMLSDISRKSSSRFQKNTS